MAVPFFRIIGKTLLLWLLLTPALPAAGETVSRIAAVVNDRIITTHQLRRAVDEYLAGEQVETPLKPEQRRNLRQEVLNRLIEEALVQQKIEELGLEVGDAEVEEAIQDVQSQNQLTREQLRQALAAQGMSFEAYQENLRKQILRFKLIGREVQSKVEVTSREVRDYFREHIDDYREPPYMRISRLTFPVPAAASEQERQAVRARAAEARQRLAAGQELEAVLGKYAEQGLAEGGDMGVFHPGELSPVFDRAIRDLEQGAVSNIVEGPAGDLYLFKVDVREPGSIRQFDAVEQEIEKKLLEQDREERFQEWAKGLREDAYIDIRI